MKEIANGCVVGAIINPCYYRFYSVATGRLLWDAGAIKSDVFAKNAFIDKFSVDPDLFKKYKKEGVEMRVWSR